MKKILATIGFAAISSVAFSQTVLDAISSAKTDPVLGNARYSGMAGAFTALGGNASAVKDNPAALGVYRSHEITFSPSLYINNDGEVKGALDNFAFVLNFGGKKARTNGYITSSLALNYDRTNISRYTRRKDTKKFSMSDEIAKNPNTLANEFATNIGLIEDGISLFGDGLVDRELRFMEKGHVGQWDIAYGLNISNRFYVGAGFGFTTLQYKQTSMYTENSETPMTDGSVIDDQWYIDNLYEASGNGFNFRVGAIVRPVDLLRVGVSFETPTYYNMEEYYNVELGDQNLKCNEDFGGAPTIYDLRTPLKFKAGLGFVVGKRALIDLDYQYENFQKTRLKVDDMYLDSETDVAEAYLCKTHTIKLGAEVQVVDGFFLRGGLAFSSKPFNDYSERDTKEICNFRGLSFPQQSIYVTGGAGYKGEHFYCDLAYAFRNTDNILYNYLPLVKGDESLHEDLKTRNIIATFGWRF